MERRSKHTIKNNIANLFGSFGYLFCFFQWFWVVMLYFSVIQSVTSFIYTNTNKPIERTPDIIFTPPSSSTMIIFAIIATIMAALTVYILIRIPINIVKTSNKFVHKTAEAMTPVVIKSQHKHNTKKNHIKITPKLILVIKLLLIIIPMLLTALSGLQEKQSIDHSIALVVSGGLVCLSTIFFAVQYLLAALLRVRMSRLW